MANLNRIRIDNFGLITQSAGGRMQRFFLQRATIDALKADTVREFSALSRSHPELGQFLDASGALVARLDIVDQAAECLSRPLRIYYNIEPRCNLKCEFCGPRDLHHDFTPGSEETENFLLEQIADAGSFQVQLTGGEIFVRGFDLFKTLRKTDELGLATLLGTNGVWRHIEDREGFIAELASFNHILEIKVSVDGNRDFHDSIRGQGTYDEARRTLLDLAEKGFSTRINATIFKVSCTLEQIKHLAGLAKETNSGLQVIPVREAGRAQCLSHLAMPGPEELYHYTMLAKELRERLGIIISYNFDIFGGGRQLPVYDPERPFSCGAGLWGFAITHTGEVYPCGFSIEAGDPNPFLAGRVSPQQSLLDIWLNSPVLWDWRHAGKSDECRSCSDYLQGCWGGCMVQAWLSHGALNAPDPYCLRSFKTS